METCVPYRERTHIKTGKNLYNFFNQV